MNRSLEAVPGAYPTELMRAFRIGPDDLEANRAGQLSDRQVKRLISSGMLNLLGTAAIAAAVSAILFLVAEKPLKPVQVMIAVVLSASALTVGIAMFVRTRAAVAAGRVDCVTGPAFARLRGRAGWYLRVEDRSFRLPVQFWRIENGAPYRVYVTPKVNRIVAMEPDGWG
jgi:hypothetical protein